MSDLAAIKDAEIVVAVCGGIAAYKVADVVSKLVQAGAGVTVCMTENAHKFVSATTFQALTHRAVHSSVWDATGEVGFDHLKLTEKANLLLVAPATANIIAKAAAGICDDLVSTMICASGCRIVYAPAMNSRMWLNPVTQENVTKLKRFAQHFIGPEEGFLAERTMGPGRLSEPQQIISGVAELLRERMA